MRYLVRQLAILELPHKLSLLCLTAMMFWSGCAPKDLTQLQLEHRQLEKSCAEKNEALSRENRIYFKAKGELEDHIAGLRDSLERVSGQLKREKALLKSVKESSNKRIIELEQKVADAAQSCSSAVSAVIAKNTATVDSLVLVVDTVATQLLSSRNKYSTETAALKAELAKQKSAGDKEIYALTRLKEELFAKLKESERTIVELQSTLRKQTASSSAEQSHSK